MTSANVKLTANCSATAHTGEVPRLVKSRNK
jgi:hypothetical protein